jgi:predicted transcriptional regulator
MSLLHVTSDSGMSHAIYRLCEHCYSHMQARQMAAMAIAQVVSIETSTKQAVEQWAADIDCGLSALGEIEMVKALELRTAANAVVQNAHQQRLKHHVYI